MTQQLPITFASQTPSPAEMAEIAAIAYADAGIVIATGKTGMVQSRLTKRLRVLNLPSYATYLALVKDPAGIAERHEMISSLTTNVSHFFRENHHFEALRKEVLPPLIERLRAGDRVRIWSAGCANGQEAYSIAMTLLDMAPDAADRDFRILATDIDPKVIATARCATYDDAVLEPVEPRLRARFLEMADGGMRLNAAIRKLVSFQELNLHAAWPMKGQFDVIFCRNVVIYFDPPTQARLWTRFAGAMTSAGRLFVGHSERVPTGPGSAFVSAGITTYRLGGA